MLATTKHLAKMRREHPAIRPTKFGVFGERIPSASQVDLPLPEGPCSSTRAPAFCAFDDMNHFEELLVFEPA